MQLGDPDPIDSPEEQAARWAARSVYGEMTAESRAALREWLSADRRNRGAYLRARAALLTMEEAVIKDRPQLASANDNWQAVGSAVMRSRWGRRFLFGGVTAAACALALVAIRVPPLDISAPTAAVARQQLPLADGSIVTLEDGAKISVAMTDGIRRITLQRGQATFQVAKDRDRPFVVRSGDVYFQAMGTIYTVRRIGDTGGAVDVAEGRVLVWARDERDQAVLLHAGGKLTLDPGVIQPAPEQKAVEPLPPPELAQISLDNVSVASAVARFNRMNQTKIIIGEPEIGEKRIVGLFRADDPRQFAEAAAAITGARVVDKGDNIVIEMK